MFCIFIRLLSIFEIKKKSIKALELQVYSFTFEREWMETCFWLVKSPKTTQPVYLMQRKSFFH